VFGGFFWIGGGHQPIWGIILVWVCYQRGVVILAFPAWLGYWVWFLMGHHLYRRGTQGRGVLGRYFDLPVADTKVCVVSFSRAVGSYL
jgi:hypothetical protein